MDDLVQRLENWALWARDKPRYEHCRSLEHRYRTPQVWEPVTPRLECDWKDAVIVERAVTKLPARHRVVIVGHHLYRADPRSISRRAGLNWHGFDEHLHRAEGMLRNVLGRRG